MMVVQVAAFALPLKDVLNRIDQTSGVRSAELAVDEARTNLNRLGFAGDFSLAIAPQAKATTEFVAAFPEQTDIGATITAKIPVGLSDSAQLQLRQAAENLRTAEQKLVQARDNAYVEVYGLFVQAWLVQREQEVLQAELEGARTYAAALESQFQAGKVSLVELTTANDDLRRKETASTQGELSRRLTWLKLADQVQLPFTPDTPNLDLDPASKVLRDLPLPPELINRAVVGNPDLNAIRSGMDGIEAQIAILGRPDLTTTLQVFGGAADHSVSLAYLIQQPQLSAAYSFPLYSSGSIPGNNAANLSDTWNIGVGFSLSFGGAKGNSLESATLQVQRAQDAQKLDLLRRSLELEIRSRYQEWLAATQETRQARDGLSRAEKNSAIVTSRRTLGLASDYEVPQATALLKRAEFSLLAAESAERIKLLSAANIAGYLTSVVPEIKKGEK
jgi:outer membrane protein TolC